MRPTGGGSSQWGALQPALTPCCTRARRNGSLGTCQHLWLQSELHDWLLHPPEGCALIKFEPLLHWVVEMTGPDSAPGMPTLYAGETFRSALLHVPSAWLGRVVGIVQAVGVMVHHHS